jgi:hypothetical protein
VPPTTKDREKTLAKKADKISLGIDTKPCVIAKAPKSKASASKTKIRVKNRVKKLRKSSF